MSSIGIIANPASGKDIRRLISYATTIDNHEKVNIVKRIVLAAQGLGIKKVYIMPDTFCIGHNIAENLAKEGVLTAEIVILEMAIEANDKDSTNAARLMEELAVDCIVVLGGDGTSRAVAKGITHTPIIPVSTGTNNVYPQMLEGTVVGMAAAATTLLEHPEGCILQDKRIDVYLNGQFVDLALVDVVLTKELYPGAKAIWDYKNLRLMVVAICHPAAIGFSTIAGCLQIIEAKEDKGLLIHFGPGGRRIKAPVAAGVLSEINIEKIESLALGQRVEFEIQAGGMLALDGEREIKVREGDTLGFSVVRKGPYRVSPREIIESAMLQGMYSIKAT